jgi:hypothetical protein
VQKRIAVDLARLDSDAERLRDVELTLGNAATQHDAHPLALLHTVAGIGTILRLVRRSDLSDINRVPRGQAFAASGRLGKGATASNGTRAGSSGTNLGHAHLTWAFAEAAVFFLRDPPAGQQLLVSLEQNPGQGKAFPLFAHPLSRAVSYLFKRQVACDRHSFLNDEGRGGGEPDASLDTQGLHLLWTTLAHASIPASLNA